jgi:hypothetical protein
MSPPRLRAILISIVVACLLGFSDARPFRGSMPWSVILCSFRGSNSTTPRTPAFYSNRLATLGTGGLSDYWNTVSYGSVSMAGTVVTGWSVCQAASLQLPGLVA